MPLSPTELDIFSSLTLAVHGPDDIEGKMRILGTFGEFITPLINGAAPPAASCRQGSDR